jgi:acyl dehydratase
MFKSVFDQCFPAFSEMTAGPCPGGGGPRQFDYTGWISQAPETEHHSMAVTVVPKEKMTSMAGTRFEPGEWITIDQDRINAFADCTEDHQYIHIDPERAAQTPFGGTIAHGFLTLSMLVKMMEGVGLMPENVVMGINYGFDKIRFLAPVRAGKRVRVHAEVVSVEQKDDNRFLVKQGISVEIEGEETPALVAEWLSMVVTG